MLWSMRLRSSVRLIAFATGCRLGRMPGNSGTSIACCSANTEALRVIAEAVL